MTDTPDIEYDPVGKNGQAIFTAKRGDSVLLVEKFDPTRSTSRKRFLDALCRKDVTLNRAELERELLRVAKELADKAAAKDNRDIEDEPDPAELLQKMPADVVDEARKMLESPDLLQRIVADIEAAGVAGERELASTVYLVGTSRLLPRPLAAIVQGPSASGKSYCIDRVATLFPPEAVIHATQMTPQALFHMRPGALVHRFVVAGERSRKEDDETAEASRALREMIGSGKLTKLMPMKVRGEIETVTIEQPGPIAYIESTTLGFIFAEDANRCILLATDERREQTKRIITTLAASYTGGPGSGDAERVVARHHAAQRLLCGQPVVVPYAERLGELVASDRIEARRAFPQLVSMVQASALLHQRQRPIDAEARIVAQPDDFQLARHLLAGPLSRLLGGQVSPPARRFWHRLRETFPRGGTFTTKDAAAGETGSPRSVRGWLAELDDAQAVEVIEPAKGPVPAKWRLTEMEPEELDQGVLPTAEQVFS